MSAYQDKFENRLSMGNSIIESGPRQWGCEAERSVQLMLQEQEYVHRANEERRSSNQQVVDELIAGYEGGAQYESSILTGAAFKKDRDEGDLEEPEEQDHGK